MKKEKVWSQTISIVYLNVEILKNSEIGFGEVTIMKVISQNASEDNSEIIKEQVSEEYLKELFERGLVTFIKPKRKNQDKYELVRASKKAKDILNLIRIPDIEEGDIKMFDYLCQKYLNHEDEDRTIGNKKKTLQYCAIFRKYNNLTLHQMYYLCMHFLDEYKYTKILERIFFDSNRNRYGRFENNVEDSPLYQYLDENREKMQGIWEKNIKE